MTPSFGESVGLCSPSRLGWPSPAGIIFHLALSAAICGGSMGVVLGQPTINSATGYTVTYNGNQASFFTNVWNGSSQMAPDNIALQAQGGTAFASSQLGGDHQTNFANDGIYGNNRSWLPGSGSNNFLGIAFSAPQSLSSIAWGRDNGRNGTPISSGGGGDTAIYGGQFTDRAAGSFTLQFTTVANPGAGTSSGDWTTLATIGLANGNGFLS